MVSSRSAKKSRTEARRRGDRGGGSSNHLHPQIEISPHVITNFTLTFVPFPINLYRAHYRTNRISPKVHWHSNKSIVQKESNESSSGLFLGGSIRICGLLGSTIVLCGLSILISRRETVIRERAPTGAGAVMGSAAPACSDVGSATTLSIGGSWIVTVSGKGFLGPRLPVGSQPFMLHRNQSQFHHPKNLKTYILTLIPNTPWRRRTCRTA
jgi:hypothetical protein